MVYFTDSRSHWLNKYFKKTCPKCADIILLVASLFNVLLWGINVETYKHIQKHYFFSDIKPQQYVSTLTLCMFL